MHIDVDMHKELAHLVTRGDAEHLTEIRDHWQGILLSLFPASRITDLSQHASDGRKSEDGQFIAV